MMQHNLGFGDWVVSNWESLLVAGGKPTTAPIQPFYPLIQLGTLDQVWSQGLTAQLLTAQESRRARVISK